MSSPFQNKMKRQQRRSERLMRRAARISARQSGESMGGIDYELPKVQKILGKTNNVKTISYNDVDPRLEEQGRRYDSSINYGSVAQMASPLNAYVSTAGHFQRLQDNIARAFTPTKGNKADYDATEENKEYLEPEEQTAASKVITGDGFGNRSGSKPIAIEDIDVYDESDLEFDNY